MWIRAGGGEVQTDLVGHGGDEGPAEVLGVKLIEGWSWARSSKPAGCAAPAGARGKPLVALLLRTARLRRSVASDPSPPPWHGHRRRASGPWRPQRTCVRRPPRARAPGLAWR
jgi:hypothetical protein